MRALLPILVLMGCCVPVRAGVYNTIEGHVDVPIERVVPVVRELRAAALEPAGRPDPASLRARYQRQVTLLEQSKEEDTLSTVDRVNLGASYIRLGRYRDAIRLLEAGDRTHFMIQANLATAYDLSGNPERALSCQERVLLLWPEVFAGWKQQHLDFYKECERAYLRLLRNRLDENRGGRPPTLVDIDPIFPGFRLIGPGEGGAYAAGALAPEVMQKLPSQAYGITLQLVLWLPQDPRLYWLLSELLNAGGHVDVAYEIMSELVENGRHGAFRGLFQHRRELQGPATVVRTLRRASRQGHLLAELMAFPRPTLAPGVAGVAAYQGSAAAAEAMGLALEKPQVPPLPPEPDPTPAAPPLPFNWRHVTVGFGFGFLVAALLGFQLQEWKRRRSRPVVDGEAEGDARAPVEQQSTSVQPPGV